jgi:hypothetical protein
LLGFFRSKQFSLRKRFTSSCSFFIFADIFKTRSLSCASLQQRVQSATRRVVKRLTFLRCQVNARAEDALSGSLVFRKFWHNQGLCIQTMWCGLACAALQGHTRSVQQGKPPMAYRGSSYP